TRGQGKSGGVAGPIHLPENPAEPSVEVETDPASLETGSKRRDAHLRSPAYFGVERYPEITFRSTKIEGSSPAHFLVHGDLSVHGVTRPVTLDAEYHGPASDPPGGRRASFSATTEGKRQDVGVTWNAALEGGGVVVGNKIRLELEVEATKEP